MSDHRRLVVVLALIALVVIVIANLVFPPTNFPVGKVLEIPIGATTDQIADILFEEKIIRSPVIFRTAVLRRGGEERLQAGWYQFETPLTVEQVIVRLRDGIFVKEPIKLTAPEGLSLNELAKLVNKTFPQISVKDFEAAGAEHQGYLFPDTYQLPANLSAEQLVRVMAQNFEEQVGPTSEEVVKMAALVEAEAKTKTDREIIAGILWKRFNKNMRLEVDVATSTYQTTGFPPRPIVNPGLESIKAALDPKESPYLFYLSDKTGQMHYAKTFAEHQANINKYLK